MADSVRAIAEWRRQPAKLGALQASAAIASKDPKLSGKKENLLPNFTFVNSLAQFSGPIIGGVLADAGSFLFVFAAFIGFTVVSTLSAWLLPKLNKRSG
ncbi:hypothetical protein [Paenibacillus agricola]|uniref:MFS transporter n=1 Tax=Paenibacillus agricola TaxID=2716264 RepID=A0ABX0J235_9BACL|nr:hypothetical protein [Paenibacillus agricola]NHN29491.1 hypothetical protein [Paenibacillus agricola]